MVMIWSVTSVVGVNLACTIDRRNAVKWLFRLLVCPIGLTVDRLKEAIELLDNIAMRLNRIHIVIQSQKIKGMK